MKRKIKILLILLGMMISSVIFTKQASAQQADVSFQEFYDQLSPYGEWVDHPDWGYIWLPDVGEDFVPYSTAGSWVLTNYGWTWVSDYEWGWAPFHYGRWDYDNYYGWFWVPDSEWGPAWVTWRSATGYYGWAPMRPGVSINLSFGSRYNNNLDHWMFVRDRDLDRHDINHYFVNRYDYDMILGRSRVINRSYLDNRRHATYISGPGRDEVQRVFGRLLNLFTLQDYDRPGHNFGNGRLQMYRPQVRKYDDRGNDNGYGRGRDGMQKPAPARVVNRDDVRRHSVSNSDRNSLQQRNVNPYQSGVRGNKEAQQPQNMNRSRNATPYQQGVRGNQVTPQPQRDQPQRVQRDQPQSNPPQRVQRDQPQREQPQRVTPPASQQRRAEPTRQRVEPTQSKAEPARQRAEPTRQRVESPQRKTEPAQPQRTRSEKEKKAEQDSRRR